MTRNRATASVTEQSPPTEQDSAKHQPTRAPVGNVVARVKLRRRVEQFGGTSVVAQMLGCTSRYVRMLMSPQTGTLPSLPLSKKIADELGIPQSDWCEPAPESGKETTE